MENRDKKIAAAALLIFAGGVIGAGMALLFAPKSGVRMRRDILCYSKKARSRVDKVADDLASNISELVDTIGDKTDDLLEKGKDAAGGASKELIKLIEEGASKLEKFRTLLSRIK